ncbi:hypothetical protein FFLO_00814 [Filobasidium floriforme]|uniref:PUB domain-containing protein n=1 Tax=Filobasidium floriforme TaxID=5210 RepID=A0A8K0NTG8_9TREE|nr:uncharacterized protein HD553DRAFT_226034 [Filobasidium floriforme]KAG7571302.1 hypothetical protein FFLO_00814 [Filobasidium floriforme]KAH8085817.1 hypothetical protein HD553DRAFT_226034 [Filobasidium floriforme]
MAETTPKKIPTATEKRAAALAAIEARARNGPLSSTPQEPSSNSTPGAWTPPSPEEDRKRKLELGRIVARDIMGSNNYTSAATCIETLLKIANNVLSNPTEQKFTQIKTNNAAMKRTVLDVKGGQDYLVAMGFRSRTISFTQSFVLEPFPLRPGMKHGLELGVQVLEAHLTQALDRLDHSTASATILAAQESEAARKKRALAEIDADRERVKERLEREKIGREAREKKKREEEERLAQEEREEEERLNKVTGEGGQDGERVDGGSDEVGDEGGDEAQEAQEIKEEAAVKHE